MSTTAMIATSSRAIAECSEWLLTGTTAGGDRVEVRGCDLFEFRLGKVVRKDSYWKIVER